MHKQAFPERGNILFLILLAVALFAALAYAVTSSMRGGGKDAGNEKAGLLASQLLENGALIENTITRAMLVENIPEYGFDFYNAPGTYQATANATCTTGACKIYSTNGGNVPPLMIPAWATTGTTALETSPAIIPVKILNIGGEKDEVVLRYIKLSKPVCDAINQRLGHGDINLASMEAWGYSGGYSGTMTSLSDNYGGVLGDENTALKGKKAFCLQHSGQGYTFVYAVMER